MTKPVLLDTFCKAGGATKGYQRVGFHVVGVDIEPQPRYCGDEFVQADALEYLAEHGHEFDAIHASPPCQGYSIMQNLPWLREREYPLLILPVREMLEALGKPYVIENVYGARHGAKGLAKRGLEAHGMKAQWLCGAMFGLPFYRHRLFETPFFWMAPAHPKHVSRRGAGVSDANRGRGVSEQVVINGREWDENGKLRLGRGYEHVAFNVPRFNPVNSEWRGSLASWQGNGAQAAGVGVGHAAGWRLAAKAMGIDWMKRHELTQAIPPAFTEYVGCHLMAEVNR